MSANVGFAPAIAEIGMLLRESPHAPAASFNAAIARARQFRQDDADGYRGRVRQAVRTSRDPSEVPKLQSSIVGTLELFL
jgi:hypothetical protein